MLSIGRQAGRRLPRPGCSGAKHSHCGSPEGHAQFVCNSQRYISTERRPSLKRTAQPVQALKTNQIIRGLSRTSSNWKDGQNEGHSSPKLNSNTDTALKSPTHLKPVLDLPQLDKKWRANWKQGGTTDWKMSCLTAEDYQPLGKMYILPMFPYPSGDLHLGHLRVYTISDVLGRFKRMQGYDVMHPIGWDAFGLPAENAAIERGIDPASWTKRNIEKMKGQLETMNGHWDWDREFATCDPEFYKHTQRLFLLLHERGFAYQAKSLVNYDPADKTVLANEQVDSNGNSWRSGAKVEKRLLKQWFLKISEFRQELLDDLEKLSEKNAWPERVLAMQKNWIGKSQGAQIKFSITAFDQNTHSDIEVFTTRPDTLFGVQYIALASTHPIVQKLAKNDVELQAFLDTIPALPPDSKIGYVLPHVRAINPLAFENETPDATKGSLPIYVAPYVLGDYGDGAVMGVPGHDVRDHAFWKHNRYDDPVRMVISSSPDDSTIVSDQPYVHHGHLTPHSGSYAGETTASATKKIVKLLESKNRGGSAETWRLRDWLISRQRYWGTPIPIIHCDSCGAVPVPEDQLPVKLPPVQEHWAKGKAGNPLETAHDWVNTSCPKCGEAAKRDTDTMDTFVDSSWYFMRFPDAKNPDMPFSPEAANACLPVDLYIGGVEHAILHLLYARFISKFMATTPYWPAGSTNGGEPFKRVLTQGMVHGKTYTDPATGRFLKPAEVDTSKSQPLVFATGERPNVSFEKMSKSKYNGVDPSTCIDKYGADATRAHILFQAPVSEVLEWDEEKIAGITRWMKKLHDHIHQWRMELGFLGRGRRSTPRSMVTTGAKGVSRCSEGKDEPFVNFNLDIKQAFIDYVNIQPRELLENKSKDDELDARNVGTDKAKALWRMVQKTVINTTSSYNNGYSLNTVVSDLMSLTNTLLEYKGKEEGFLERETHFHALLTLVKIMAPICPAFAEECWSLLSYAPPIPTESVSNAHDNNTFTLAPPYIRTSVFNHAFPTEDGTYEMLAPGTQTCSVQVNGKLKCVLDLNKAPGGLVGKDLEKWIVEEVLGIKEGKEKLINEKLDVRGAKKVVVVKGGRLVNFVVGKK